MIIIIPHDGRTKKNGVGEEASERKGQGSQKTDGGVS